MIGPGSVMMCNLIHIHKHTLILHRVDPYLYHWKISMTGPGYRSTLRGMCVHHINRLVPNTTTILQNKTRSPIQSVVCEKAAPSTNYN